MALDIACKKELCPNIQPKVNLTRGKKYLILLNSKGWVSNRHKHVVMYMWHDVWYLELISLSWALMMRYQPFLQLEEF